jgi:hypothetical protein
LRLATRPTSKCHFIPGLPNGSLKIPKVGISMTLGAHNFECKPSIEMRSKEKLSPLLKTFQQYVTRQMSCKPILDIYVPRFFQWYKELFDPMGFDPYYCFLKILESIRTPTLKMGAHLGVWGFIPSHFPTLLGAWDVTPGLPSWRAPLQDLALVASPRLRLWHKHVDVFLHECANAIWSWKRT